MSKKISFIIPSLGRDTLSRSIDSLLKQKNPNWECIIIFDGVDPINFDDERIKTIKTEKIGGFTKNHGTSGLVRNFGLRICNTEWIGFLDDDDTIHENYVETLFEKYNDYDFIIWRMKYLDGRILPPTENNHLSYGNFGISFCYKNKFNDLFFDSNREGEDFDFVHKLKGITTNFIVAPEIFYNVRH